MHTPKAVPQFHHITLTHQQMGDAVVLDAISTGDRLRVFCLGTCPEGFLSSGSTAQVRNIGGHAVLSGKPVDFPADLAADAPVPDLFQDRNTLLAFRNGQTTETVVQWLRWHSELHAMDAALIVDRAAPGSDQDFIDRLKDSLGERSGLKVLVVVQFDCPLGDPTLPDEQHPFCAPDAPGKDRMDIPKPDAWRSPLGVLNVIELMRWRFLSAARAVGLVDVSDLIAPKDGTSLFDQAVTAKGGAIPLQGRKAYPWRVRKGQEAHFTDHSCRQFDINTTLTRWCAVPSKIPETRLWRPFFLPSATIAGVEPWPFYRCMGLRHQAEPVSKIVPKTALVEDDELIGHTTGFWDAKPVRVPARLKQAPAKEPNSVAIVTCMKNEGPFILEWLAYHRVIGVTNFLVYTNDCTDGTDSFLDLLQEKGLVEHRDNPFRQSGMKPQHAALHAADDEPIMRQSDWQICMDVDEFINVHVGEGRLSDLFEAVGDANMISLTWRLFGNSDVHTFSDQPLISEFTRCAAQMTRKPHQAWGFKTLFRNLGIFKKLGVHRPKGLNPQLWEEIKWVNGSGKPMPKANFRNAWRSTKATVGYELVSLNHYAVRSAESFLVKRDRGRVNHVDRDQGLAYWFRMNHNLVEDRSIQRMLPALRGEMNRLLSDPDIAQMHAQCIKAHRAKIEELKATPNYAAFFETLTGARMEKLSRQLAHFGANVFLAGPDVIPDDIATGDHPADFFFTVEKQDTQH